MSALLAHSSDYQAELRVVRIGTVITGIKVTSLLDLHAD